MNFSVLLCAVGREGAVAIGFGRSRSLAAISAALLPYPMHAAPHAVIVAVVKVSII